MFDIAFSELVVIALVALIVIGPERLPKVARTAGLLWGRVQRYVQGVKSDIAHDMAIEEARKLHSNLQQDVAAAGKVVQETGLTLEQSLLQAQYRKTPETPASPQPSSLPDKHD